MTDNKLDGLDQFTKATKWHRNQANPGVFYTDGAKYVADKFDAHWLLDKIARLQRQFTMDLPIHHQVSTLSIDENGYKGFDLLP